MIALIAGKGGWTGLPNDPVFGNPSPLQPLKAMLATQADCRIEHFNHDDSPDPKLFKPDKDDEPLMIVGHSFGGFAAVQLSSHWPQIVNAMNFPNADTYLFLCDPVNPAAWGWPFQNTVLLTSSVRFATCYLRTNDLALPPFHFRLSEVISLPWYNEQMPDTNHVSIVESASGEILSKAIEVFGAKQ